MKNKNKIASALLLLPSIATYMPAQAADKQETTTLSDVVVSDEQITTPTATEKYKLPQVTESVTKEKLEDTVNVMNTEDAIKY
ncbi:MAG: hypothetical protein LUQ11_08370, partial [Methylococcaceae bacterium]|nr:hypothetical protein [Methylococcaceae bacterium]